MYSPGIEPANVPWLSNGLQEVSGLTTLTSGKSNIEYFDSRKYLRGIVVERTGMSFITMLSKVRKLY